jgi:hypothetical protein
MLLYSVKSFCFPASWESAISPLNLSLTIFCPETASGVWTSENRLEPGSDYRENEKKKNVQVKVSK